MTPVTRHIRLLRWLSQVNSITRMGRFLSPLFICHCSASLVHLRKIFQDVHFKFFFCPANSKRKNEISYRLILIRNYYFFGRDKNRISRLVEIQRQAIKDGKSKKERDKEIDRQSIVEEDLFEIGFILISNISRPTLDCKMPWFIKGLSMPN